MVALVTRAGKGSALSHNEMDANFEGLRDAIRGRNVLINGDFNVWQEGTSWAGLTVIDDVADMWEFSASSQGMWTVERSTDVPTVSEAGRHLSYSLKATVTTADATTNAGDYAQIVASVEGYDYAPLYQQTQTVRFWVKSGTPGTYCVSLRNSGNDRSYVGEFTIAAMDTWELKTVTVTATPSGGTWDYTNGTGIRLSVALAAGSTYQTTAGAWQSGNFIATANQANLAATLGNYINLADVRLVYGEDAGDVAFPSFAEQLAMCQRYYEKSYDYDVAPGAVATDGATIFRLSLTGTVQALKEDRYAVYKRAAPTVTIYSTGGASGNVYNTATAADCPAGASDISASGHSLSTTSGTQNDGNLLRWHWVAAARL